MSTPHAILERLAGMGIVPSGVADDSRQVQAGDLFLAYPGALADGRRYIGDALARGAVAVLWQPGEDFVWGRAVPNFAVPALRALPFRVGLARDAASLAELPRERGAVTLLRLSDGRLDGVDYLRDTARIRAALGLP